MKVGDIFYSIIQKDNNPFEKPKIVKFIVKEIDNDYPLYPIISIKQDKWGRYYRFKESQIYLTYEDALVEKKKIIEKIKNWETEKAKRDKVYFEEQERKEKQKQLEHDNQIRADERKRVCDEIRQNSVKDNDDDGNIFYNVNEELLDQIEMCVELEKIFKTKKRNKRIK